MFDLYDQYEVIFSIVSCVALRCVALNCVALHCIAFHCIVLYCIVGLLDYWYDGCFGWMHTVNRDQVLKFGVEYMPGTEGHFYVKKGKTFNGNNISGKKIGNSYMYSVPKEYVLGQ